MKKPNHPITNDERKHWSTLGHLFALEGISEATEWTGKDFAFHGGTSLHLSWNSPRFSEDLDFLLDKRCAERLSRVMTNVKKHIEQRLALIDPQMEVELLDKSGDRLGDFRFTLSRPGVIGSVMVKCEFWKVDPAYLQQYKSANRSPGVPADLGGYRLNLNIMLPAATLQSSYVDKLTAFATRPFLKMRDIFDFWWVSNNAQFEPPEDLANRLLHNLSVYETVDNLAPADALRAFSTRRTQAEMMDAAEKDLRPFLPQTMWNKLWPDTVAEMIDCAVKGAAQAAVVIDAYCAASQDDEPNEECDDGPRR